VDKSINQLKREAVVAKVHENRLRRWAGRQALRLEKSPRRDYRAIDYGKYRLVDLGTGEVVDRKSKRASTFASTLDDIERMLS
jgi:hypothetical protein